jgi:arylsulfatase
MRAKRTATFITLFCVLAFAGPARAADRPPNVVLIMADDLGYAEVGCYGQRTIQTPHIDRLAAEGVRFTQAYCGSPVCAPSRCVLMTGKHTGHAYTRNNGYPPDRPRDEAKGLFPGQHPIPDAEVTLPELLKARGYATGAMGKWGLGGEGTTGDPNKQGWDLFFGYYCQWHAHNHYPRFLLRNGERVPLPGNDRTLDGEHHSQDLFIDEALKFVKANKDRPFLLYLPFTIPHLSIQSTEKWVAKYRGLIPEQDYEHKGYLRHPHPRAGYAAMVSQMDDGIGQVMALLGQLGLDDNTIVIFTSDNGPTYDRLGGSDSVFFNSAGGLRGYKGSVYEGGIRVPLIVRWPGLVKAGAVSEHVVASWDVLPTVMAMIGSANDTPSGVDGVSLAPTLLGRGEQKRHEYLYWEFPAYTGQQAVRWGHWKGVRRNMMRGNLTVELYNLATDREEQFNVAAEHPDVVKKIESIMAEAHEPSELFPLRPID